MATYNQFDVVIVPFPFTDVGQVKRRPALVVSDASSFNSSMQRSVMAMITTASRSPWSLDVPILDLSYAGLNTPSIIRMKLFTLDHSLVIRRIGALGTADQISVQDVLKKLIRLE